MKSDDKKYQEQRQKKIVFPDGSMIIKIDGGTIIGGGTNRILDIPSNKNEILFYFKKLKLLFQILVMSTKDKSNTLQ